MSSSVAVTVKIVLPVLMSCKNRKTPVSCGLCACVYLFVCLFVLPLKGGRLYDI